MLNERIMKQKLERRCKLEKEYQTLLNLAQICRSELVQIDKTLNIFDPQYSSLEQHSKQQTSRLESQKKDVVAS